MFSEFFTRFPHSPDRVADDARVRAARRIVEQSKDTSSDAVKFYFIEAMQWRMEAALKKGFLAVKEEERLVEEDVMSWLEEFGLNVPTEFGYLQGYDKNGMLKIVRRHPIRDQGLDLAELLESREDMRAVYRKAKEYLPPEVQYREDDNVFVMDYFTEHISHLADRNGKYFMWPSPPPPVSEGSKKVGYGSSTHSSVFRLEEQGSFVLIHGVTVVSELSNRCTRDFIQKLVSPDDPRYHLVQKLSESPSDRDLLQLAFEIRQGVYSETNMSQLAWIIGNELLQQGKSGSEPNKELLQKQEEYLAEQQYALNFSPTIQKQLSGLRKDLIYLLQMKATKEQIERKLRQIWMVGKDAYKAHLIKALEETHGRVFTEEEKKVLDEQIGLKYNARAEGRGCPSMKVNSGSKGISVTFDAKKGVYVDAEGNEYSPDAKVTCKHCGTNQYLVANGKVKTVCEICGKSPCEEKKVEKGLFAA